MKSRKRMLVVLVMLLGLMVAVQPVAGQPPHAVMVSGYGCAKVEEYGEMEIVGQELHVRGRVLYVEYDSENEEVLPDGSQTLVVNTNRNLKTGTINFHRRVTMVPSDSQGTFVGVDHGWSRIDSTGGYVKGPNISGVLHGTGEFEGLTMKLTYEPAAQGLCPEGVPGESWSGYIVPPGE